MLAPLAKPLKVPVREPPEPQLIIVNVLPAAGVKPEPSETFKVAAEEPRATVSLEPALSWSYW